MPKQLPERVLGFEIPLVPEVGSLAEGHRLLVVFDVAATHPGGLLPLRDRRHRGSTSGLGVHRGFTMLARLLLLLVPMMRISRRSSPIGGTRITSTLPAARRVLAGIVVAAVGCMMMLLVVVADHRWFLLLDRSLGATASHLDTVPPTTLLRMPPA